jgi:hypothetical protein
MDERASQNIASEQSKSPIELVRSPRVSKGDPLDNHLLSTLTERGHPVRQQTSPAQDLHHESLSKSRAQRAGGQDACAPGCC